MTRTEAHTLYAAILEKAAQQGPEQVRLAQRELGVSDLFFLLVYVLRRKDVDDDWLYARCREVEANPNGYLDLWAREHYKSTIITFALTIQDILKDPNTTVGIFSHTRPIAKDFLRQIMREFEQNELLKSLFPDVLWAEPRKQSPSWSLDNGIVVKRTSNPRESTVEAWGLVDGQPIGKHFRKLVYDDVVTRESVNTPEQINRTTEAWALSLALGTKDGDRRYIGTRYHFGDSYHEIMQRGAATPRIHPATEDGTVDGNPVFLSRARLADLRKEMGPYVFGCQMLQDPKADSAQGFLEEWLRHWEPQLKDRHGADPWRKMNTYILVDPASEKKKNSDYTVMLVVGLGPDGNYYLIDGVRDRLNLAERARWLFRLHRRYRPENVGYEKYGQQADIEHMRDVMAREQYRFGIAPLGGQVPKNDRIRRLIPVFERGEMWIPYTLRFKDHEGQVRDLVREFVDDEYLAFPVSHHDDMLDCLARIVDPELGARWPEDGMDPWAVQNVIPDNAVGIGVEDYVPY